MKKLYAAVSVLAAGILALSFGVPLALGNGSHSYETQDQDNDLTECADMVATGAGWFEVESGGAMVRDFFAFELFGNESRVNESFLMFRATDIGAVISSTNFTMVTIENRTADALGWAKLDDSTGYWFDLKAVDGGMKAYDVFDLKVYNDTNANWMMDETTPVHEWVADGLGGGDIVIAPCPEYEYEHEYEYGQNITAAAGGGWFVGYNGTESYKITFGMFVTMNETFAKYNSFVLQGRNVSERIQSVNFTKVEITNQTLDAWGWCKANGMAGYWFHLTATDGGERSMDMLSLQVYSDADHDWVMNETTPSWMWNADGLDGGNIFVGLLHIGEEHEYEYEYEYEHEDEYEDGDD